MDQDLYNVFHSLYMLYLIYLLLYLSFVFLVYFLHDGKAVQCEALVDLLDLLSENQQYCLHLYD